MKNIKQMQTLSPEWYAEAYRRMNQLMGSIWALKFPANVLMWSFMVPLISVMFSTAVIKHTFIRWFFR